MADLKSCKFLGEQFLYHVTPEENVPAILYAGLLRAGGRRPGFAVSLSEKPDSWYQPGLAVLKVRITGLPHKMTSFLPESDEILVWGDIPPEYISVCKPSEVMAYRQHGGKENVD